MDNTLLFLFFPEFKKVRDDVKIYIVLYGSS